MRKGVKIMELRIFDKINYSIKTQYLVYDGKSFVKDFYIDYSRNDVLANAPAVALKDQYMDAKVVNVNVIHDTLYVTIDIKGV